MLNDRNRWRAFIHHVQQMSTLDPLAGIVDGIHVGCVAQANACIPTSKRASFIIRNMARMPLFSSPSSIPRHLPLLPSDMEQVAFPWIPIFSSTPVQTTSLGSPRLPSSLTQILGTMKQGDTVGTFGRTFDAGQNGMNDIFRQIMLAG